MTLASTTVERAAKTGQQNRRTDPLRLVPDAAVATNRRRRRRKSRLPELQLGGTDYECPDSPAAQRQRAQLPHFAPLLEELEVAGWSSHRRLLSGNFHDWMLLGGNRVAVMVGYASGNEAADATEAALVAQAAWAAVRAQAIHAEDAGEILSLASQTIWPNPACAAIAVALVNTIGGNASVAVAGDCQAWRVRAASCERIAICQPPLGSAANFSYSGHSFELALRERLILLSGDAPGNPKFGSELAARFSRINVEMHRRMAAADAVAFVRESCEQDPQGQSTATTSIAAVRRR